MRRLLVLPILLVLMSQAHAATDGYIAVHGGIDCGRWTKARTEQTSIALESYILGMANGLALGRRVDFWRYSDSNLSEDQVYYWLDNYCRENPLKSALTGLMVLFDEVTQGAFSRALQ